MTLAGILAFFLTLVGLAIIGTLIFLSMQFRPLPEPYGQFSRYAVGGAICLAVLAAIVTVIGGPSSVAVHVTIGGILEFAIGVLLWNLLLWVIDRVLAYFSVPFAAEISFALSVIYIVVILGLAYIAITTGGLGVINIGGQTFLQTNQQHQQLVR
jgi:hypothetical protein